MKYLALLAIASFTLGCNAVTPADINRLAEIINTARQASGK